MDNEIKGKIIALITERQVVINKGKIDGIEEGMIFTVRLDAPEIKDPGDSSNTLSGIFYSKGTIKINSVFERMSFGLIQPSAVYSQDYTVSGSFNFPQPQYEYPDVLGALILPREKWAIKVGDEVYLQEKPKEKQKKL